MDDGREVWECRRGIVGVLDACMLGGVDVCGCGEDVMLVMDGLTTRIDLCELCGREVSLIQLYASVVFALVIFLLHVMMICVSC